MQLHKWFGHNVLLDMLRNGGALEAARAAAVSAGKRGMVVLITVEPYEFIPRTDTSRRCPRCRWSSCACTTRC